MYLNGHYFPNLYSNMKNETLVEKFAGAVTMGKNKNLAGILLTKFVRELDNENAEENIKTVVLETIFDFGIDMINSFDIVVYNIMNDQQATLTV